MHSLLSEDAEIGVHHSKVLPLLHLFLLGLLQGEVLRTGLLGEAIQAGSLEDRRGCSRYCEDGGRTQKGGPEVEGGQRKDRRTHEENRGRNQEGQPEKGSSRKNNAGLLEEKGRD